jgi:hypothetical protein
MLDLARSKERSAPRPLETPHTSTTRPAASAALPLPSHTAHTLSSTHSHTHKLTMSSLRNAVKRVTHKERSQPCVDY